MLPTSHDHGADRDLIDIERALKALVPVQPQFSRDEFFYRAGYTAGQSAGSLFQRLLSLIRTSKEDAL
jgi:hypothetical protein